MQTRVKFFRLLACCLLSTACNQIGSRSTRPTPPATSYRIAPVDLVWARAPHAVRGAFVTPQFIEMVGQRPSLGRYFIDEEYRRNDRPVVVVSHELWQRRFESNPEIIGQGLELNGRTHTVIGVMPKGFDIPEGVDVWLPEAVKGR